MNADAARCHDVVVVGAGPAGSSAALTLAQRGADVILLEKAALPRYKTCGGGLLGRAFQQLPRAVDKVVEREFHAVELNFLGTTLSFVVTRDKPLVYMTMRAELDALLALEAERAGAKLIPSSPVRRMTLHDDFVVMATDEREFRAKFVIAGDGVHSTVAKAAGWKELPSLAPALEYEIRLNEEDLVRFSRRPRFDFNAIDAGYAWVFPKKSHVSAGILSTRPVSTDLRAGLERYLKRLGITRIEKMEKHGWLIPMAPRREPLARGRILLTGDAAGLVDPVTAEGISHAIQSGRLAAEAIVDSGFDGSGAAARYQTMLENSLLPELRAGRFLARILYHHPRLRNMAFRCAGQRLSEFVAEVASGRRTYADALKRPSSFLKVLGLKK